MKPLASGVVLRGPTNRPNIVWVVNGDAERRMFKDLAARETGAEHVPRRDGITRRSRPSGPHRSRFDRKGTLARFATERQNR
jgi:hypothetical protein